MASYATEEINANLSMQAPGAALNDRVVRYVCLTMDMEAMPLDEHEIADLRLLAAGRLDGDEYRARIRKELVLV